MTKQLRVRVSGSGDVEAAAEALKGCLGQDISVDVEPPLSGEEERKVDPIAVAALIVSIPAALVAVADLVERMRSRRKAAELIEVADQVTVTHRVEVHLMTDDGPVSLNRLSPDRLLDIANSKDTDK